jgi:hypothetical protein
VVRLRITEVVVNGGFPVVCKIPNVGWDIFGGIAWSYGTEVRKAGDGMHITILGSGLSFPWEVCHGRYRGRSV